MNGEVINLRRARKAKARVTAEASAVANRALHGITKIARDTAAAERERGDRALAGLRLEPAADEG